MASQDAFLAHIVSRMQSDIDFLVSHNVISRTDGQLMSSKLPGQHTNIPPMPVASPLQMPIVRKDVAPTPARQMSYVPQGRALWPYNIDRQDAGDLSFNSGETIEILEETNADWWTGRNPRGETGLFPSNYVEKIPGGQSLPVDGRIVAPFPNEKMSYSPTPVAPPEPPVPQQQAHQAQPPKKSKFGKYGNTMAQSAAGGVGFGAGAAIGSGIVNAIF